jgi:hypothetical protein
LTAIHIEVGSSANYCVRLPIDTGKLLLSSCSTELFLSSVISLCGVCCVYQPLSSVGLSGLCRSVGLSVDSLTGPTHGTCRNSVDLCRTSVDLCRLTIINSVGLCRSSVGLCRDFLSGRSVVLSNRGSRANRTTVNGGTRSPGTHDTLPGRKVLCQGADRTRQRATTDQCTSLNCSLTGSRPAEFLYVVV